MRTGKTVIGISLAFVLTTVVVSACRDVTAPDRVGALAPRFDAAAAVVLERLYGPEQFTRTRGAPDEFTRNISTLRFEAPFVLHVRSGAPDGSRRAHAASVSFDGNVVVSESDFGREAEWAIPVTPAQTALLGVTLRGAPDGLVEVWLEGKRSDPVFCPNGPAGTYPTLPEALAAAAVGGTVLVCDGEHVIDRVSVQKPITIRSQNPGGATLADADPNPLPQTGQPALIVDNVPSGRVRIADLNFVVRGRGIVAQGAFDQLQIDSVNFSGRDMVTSYGVWIDASTVASAKVDVKRSRFVSLQVGVFAIGSLETNVASSTFESFAPAGESNGGAITYSGRLVNSVPAASFGRAEHNTFRNCSVNGCVRVVGPAQAGNEVTIAHNVMARPAGPSQVMAIFVGRVSTNSTPLGHVTVEANDATGVLAAGDASVPASWTMQTFVRTSGGPGGTPVVVGNNRVTGVHTGIWAASNTTARDNVLTDGYHAIAQRNSSVSVEFQRNDVIGFAGSIFRVQPGGNVGDYRCNWWGSAAGPANPGPNVTGSSYTPWATQPIANTAVGCDPAPPAMVRVCASTLEGGPMTFPTVAAAYGAVATGGTILICDGTHVVQDVRIAKAITIRAEGPGKPMLDALGVRTNFDVRDVLGGAVVFRGLQFRGTWISTDEAPRVGYGANINIEGSYSTIMVEDSHFFPSGQLVAYINPGPGQTRLTHNSGIWVWNPTGGGVTVRNNTFTGGDLGVGGTGTALVVSSNLFRGQSNAAISRGPAAGTSIIDDNDVMECGTWRCLAAGNQGTTVVTRNRVQVDAARPTTEAISVDGPDATISWNVITGIGGARTSSDRSSWPIAHGIAAHSFRRSTVSTYSISNNTISGAYAGLFLAANSDIGDAGPLTAEVTDNTVRDVAETFSSGGPVGGARLTLRLNRNDFSAYSAGTDRDNQGRHFVSVDLRCNWWGQPSGPSGYFPTQWVPLTVPLATQPIARQPDVACP